MSIQSSPDRFARARARHLEALSSIRGSDPVAQYQRETLQMAWEVATGEGPVDQHAARLRVELRGIDDIDAGDAGLVAHGLQEATAIVGAHLRSRDTVQRLGENDRHRVRLIQEAQVGGVIWLRIPSAPGDELPVPTPRPAERAVRELMEYLPHDETDRGAVNGVLGALQPIRKAVGEVAAIALGARQGLDLRFTLSNGGDVTSFLTHDNAQYLRQALEARQEVRETETRLARVDGMRNSRRVLYLIEPNGHELQVSVEDSQLTIVRSLIDRQVVARLESSQIRNPRGYRSHKVYRLLELFPDSGALPG